MANGFWVRVEQPEKFLKKDKEILKDTINCYFDNHKNLKERAKKVEIKAGRVYLYEYFEVDANSGTIIKPLIEGKYLEMPFARITIYDKQYEKCSAEYQQYNGKWFTILEGSLNNCIKYIAENEGTFN